MSEHIENEVCDDTIFFSLLDEIETLKDKYNFQDNEYKVCVESISFIRKKYRSIEKLNTKKNDIIEELLTTSNELLEENQELHEKEDFLVDEYNSAVEKYNKLIEKYNRKKQQELDLLDEYNELAEEYNEYRMQKYEEEIKYVNDYNLLYTEFQEYKSKRKSEHKREHKSEITQYDRVMNELKKAFQKYRMKKACFCEIPI